MKISEKVENILMNTTLKITKISYQGNYIEYCVAKSSFIELEGQLFYIILMPFNELQPDLSQDIISKDIRKNFIERLTGIIDNGDVYPGFEFKALRY